MSTQWASTPERGSLALIRLIAWLAQAFGRRATRLLLYPITLYFLAFNGRARRASRAYQSRLRGRPATLKDVYRHLFSFAATILDRVYFLTNHFENFDIRINGLDALTRYTDQGRGCILLGAHLGSFDAMRALATHQAELPLKILMYPENSARINQVINALNPQLADSIIPLGATETMLKVKEWLDGGGHIGVLGDRGLNDEKTLPVGFLGGTAHLPKGPLILAAATGAPVVLFTALYRGGCRYDIEFHDLCAAFTPPRAEREQAMAGLLQAYADQLAVWCAQSPDNWFNFYDYWPDEPS